MTQTPQSTTHDYQARSNQSDELLSYNQTIQDEDHRESQADESELFLDQFTDIQYEDVTSIIASLGYLNLDHTNVDS